MKFEQILYEVSLKKIGIDKNPAKDLKRKMKVKKPTVKNITEKVKDGHKRLASAAGGSATPKKVDNYMDKLEKEGDVDDIKKQIKKKGLTGKAAERYKWAVLHKRMKGHFN